MIDLWLGHSLLMSLYPRTVIFTRVYSLPSPHPHTHYLGQDGKTGGWAFPSPDHLGSDYTKSQAGRISLESRPGSFSPPPAGSLRGFHLYIHCERLIEFLEIEVTKIWSPA